MSVAIVLHTNLEGVKQYAIGKVRDNYDLGDKLLIVATDRISAFDVVLPNGIPYKGKVLNGLSEFWFERTKHMVDNHLLETDARRFPQPLSPFAEILEGRSMLVRKAERIDIECVVRGYLAGSAWKEYQTSGEVCGIKLPQGLIESDKLPEPIFTPATKAVSGHDENISFCEMGRLVGGEVANEVKNISLELFEEASEVLEARGLILADTKFEFGFCEGEIILIDEALTPDSSRFWDKDDYGPGGPQGSFDKQFVRDYLESVKWNKQPPAPSLPDGIIQKTSEKYLEAYRRIMGRNL